MKSEDLFIEAIQLSAEEREAYLAIECGDDDRLCDEVRSLIRAHETQDSLLDEIPQDLTTELSATNHTATTIGPYKLREQIGEGGMGMVFVAEQQKPVRRRVALKLIKVGMDTEEVVARFEAERQALALMDHPNIAKVFDAGNTDEGRPYFVMELVHGDPITKYCDENRLTIRERLSLFVNVCQATQHAHQKGIIHRDIKPTNVLVTEHDGRPVPKIIDFGVAKAIGLRLTEHTIYTAHMQPVGTLQYMSPEQSRLSGLDIDTRSDVYALGLLLYELLTGDLPYDKETFRSASFDEKRRIIAEEDPPRPSTKLSSLGNSSSSVCAARRAELGQLRGQLLGELDWILVKALQKDRNQRYESASALAADVESHLSGGVVDARPPSTWYQAQKLIQRHRVAIAFVAVALVLSSIGTAVSFRQWRLALIAQRELELQKGILQSVLIDHAITYAMSGHFERAKMTLEQASVAEVDPDLIEALRNMSLYFSGNPEAAAKALEQASFGDSDSLEIWGVRFLVSHSVGDYGVMGECRRRVNDMVPESDTEKLFHAMANVYANPEVAIAGLDPLLAKNPESPILNVIRAVAQRDVAQRSHSLAVLRELIEAFRVASQRVPDNYYIQNEYLLALVDGLNFAGFRGEEKLAASYQREAEELARKLESDPTRELLSRMSRATYFAAVGHWEELAVIEKTTTEGPKASPQVVSSEQFKSVADPDAITSLVEEEWEFAAPAWAFVDLDKCQTVQERSQIAAKAFSETLNGRDYAIGTDVIALEVFLFSGDFQTLAERARGLQEYSPDFEWHMYQRVLDLYASLSGDEKADGALVTALLEEVRPFGDETSYAEYVSGLIRLAHGQREQAIIHFQNCREQGKYDWWFHVWARAFLSRLNSDQSWPSWLLESSEQNTP